VFDDAGAAACSDCGARLWVGQWTGRLDLPRAILLRLAMRPVLVMVVGIAAVLGVYAVVTLLHPSVSPVSDVARAYHRLPGDFRLNLDLALIGLLLALGVRLFRRRLAALCDQQHVRCVRCGHALHASPRRAGVGQCGECGRDFFATPS
jgi:hypothetical protein